MTKYLYLDTETGGLDADTDALLTIGLVAHDDARGIMGKTEIKVQPEDLICTDGAMKVNRIILSDHMRYALPRTEAAFAVAEFVHKYFGKHFLDMPFMCGHNVGFDVRFMNVLFKDAAMKQPYSYRTLDTMGIALFMHDLGLLPSAKNLKLDFLLQHYEIEIAEEDRHTALGDALATRKLHLAMRAEIANPLDRLAGLCK